MSVPAINERAPLLRPNRTASLVNEPVLSAPIQIDPAILARAIQIAAAEQAAAIGSSQLQEASHPAPNTIPIDPAVLARSMQIDSNQHHPIESNSNPPTLILDVGEYTGETQNGLPHGMGTLIYRKGMAGKQYVGHFQNGEINGWGVLDFSNGNQFEGEFREGDLHGHGTCKWSSGAVYTGNLQNGKKDGQGTYTWLNGDTYEGEWVNDKMHGKGTLKYAYHVYQGDFRDGKFWSGTWSGGVAKPNRGTYVNGKSRYVKDCCTIL